MEQILRLRIRPAPFPRVVHYVTPEVLLQKLKLIKSYYSFSATVLETNKQTNERTNERTNKQTYRQKIAFAFF